MSMSSVLRPIPTPRVIAALQQEAFQKKGLDSIPLAKAKDLIAQEHGYDSWQHIKNSSIAYQTIARLTPDQVKAEYYISITSDIQLECPDYEDDGEESESDEEEDKRRVSVMELYSRTRDEGDPPTLPVYFQYTLSLEKRDVKESKEIGHLSGHMYFENDEYSLLMSFDSESQDLADFASDFEFKFDESYREEIFNLAFIEMLYIDEGYDESAFGRLLLEACKSDLSGIVDGLFTHPLPATEIGRRIYYDRSHGRAKNFKDLHSSCGFKPIKGNDTYLVYTKAQLD